MFTHVFLPPPLDKTFMSSRVRCINVFGAQLNHAPVEFARVLGVDIVYRLDKRFSYLKLGILLRFFIDEK